MSVARIEFPDGSYAASDGGKWRATDEFVADFLNDATRLGYWRTGEFFSEAADPDPLRSFALWAVSAIGGTLEPLPDDYEHPEEVRGRVY
ncbi:MAG: hypothetical protein GY944_08650 [bacterium]|nr:hypothetical protein [bacterium]